MAGSSLLWPSWEWDFTHSLLAVEVRNLHGGGAVSRSSACWSLRQRWRVPGSRLSIWSLKLPFEPHVREFPVEAQAAVS